MRVSRVAALAVLVVAGAAGSNFPSRLTVVVFDYTRVPHERLISAIRASQHAFGAAGVETEWILCNSVEGCYVPERFVQVKILSRALKSTPVSSHALGSTETCTATEHCAASYVFYDRVLSFADAACSPADLTLGYVMAHEIGHLMGLGHRPGGIMTAAFTSHDLHRAATGWLGFAEDDARELRSAVAQSHQASEPPRHIKLLPWRGIAAE